MGIFFSLLPVIVPIGAVAAVVVVGFFYFFGLVGKSKSGNLKDAERNNDYIIKSFKEKIEILERKVDDQAGTLREQDTRLVAIEKENRLLREILQGKDAQTVEFQSKGLAVINTIVPEILELTKNTNSNVNKLCNSIDGLVKAMNVQTTTTVTTSPIGT